MRPLDEMVSEYAGCGFLVAEQQWAYYAAAENFGDALTRATVQDEHGKIPAHQRRIGRIRLEAVRDRVKQAQSALNGAKSFQELYEIIVERSAVVPRVKELTCYDVAYRVGVFLGIRPKAVYLHAGTRRGARALGLHYRSDILEVSELPDALQALPPEHVENFLCIYEEEFRDKALRRNRRCGRCFRPAHPGCT